MLTVLRQQIVNFAPNNTSNSIQLYHLLMVNHFPETTFNTFFIPPLYSTIH
jgi:hypothetical protein